MTRSNTIYLCSLFLSLALFARAQHTKGRQMGEQANYKKRRNEWESLSKVRAHTFIELMWLSFKASTNFCRCCCCSDRSSERDRRSTKLVMCVVYWRLCVSLSLSMCVSVKKNKRYENNIQQCNEYTCQQANEQAIKQSKAENGERRRRKRNN